MGAGGGDVEGGAGRRRRPTEVCRPGRTGTGCCRRTPVLLAEPQVVAVLADAGHAVAFDERPVQDYVRDAFASAAVQDFVQVRGLLGEDVDALVQVAVAGGLGSRSVPSPSRGRGISRLCPRFREATGQPRERRVVRTSPDPRLTRP